MSMAMVGLGRSPLGKQCWPQCSQAPWAPGWGWKKNCEDNCPERNLKYLKYLTKTWQILVKYWTNVKNDTWGPRAAGREESWLSLVHTSSPVTESEKYLKQQKTWKISSVQKVTHWWRSGQLVTGGGRPRAAVSYTNGGHPPLISSLPPSLPTLLIIRFVIWFQNPRDSWMDSRHRD